MQARLRTTSNLRDELKERHRLQNVSSLFKTPTNLLENSTVSTSDLCNEGSEQLVDIFREFTKTRRSAVTNEEIIHKNKES
jgi:hypothetical protein